MTATRNQASAQAQAGRTSGSEPGKVLAIGDVVQAWHNGRLYHQGTITKTVPGLDLIWISDAATDRPKLLDPEAFEIVPASPGLSDAALNDAGLRDAALREAALRDTTPAPVTPSVFPVFSHGT